MDKNVSGVDLEELLKARQELDSERGIETDPNLYSGYNPNRESETTAQNEVSVENQNNYENITNIQDQNQTIDKPDDSHDEQDDENQELDELLEILNEVTSEANDSGEAQEEEPNLVSENSNVVSLPTVDSQDHKETVEAANEETVGNSEDNLSKLDIFAAFEVKENAPSIESQSLNNESSTVPNLKNSENEVNTSSENQSINEVVETKPEVILENAMTEKEIDDRLEKIENAEELESLLNDLLDDLDEDEEEALNNQESDELDDDAKSLYDLLAAFNDELDEDVDKKLEESLQPKIEVEENNSASLASIDIEPNLAEGVSFVEEDSDKEEEKTSDVSEDLSENIMQIKEDSNPLAGIEEKEFIPSEENLVKEDNELDKQHDDILDAWDGFDTDGSDAQQSAQSDESSDVEESVEEDNVKSVEETGEDSSLESESEDSDELESEDEASDKLEAEDDEKLVDEAKKEDVDEKSEDSGADEDGESIGDESDSEDDEQDEAEESLVEPDIDSIFNRSKISEPVPVTQKPQPVYAENAGSANDVEVITDYSQLRDILQKQLKESEEIDDSEFKKKYNFKEIEDFKFIDEIASDDFKDADKFSYILGKNEKNEMVYGNFKEHCNLAVFGKNDSVVNSLLNSLILSLCLKNSFNDVNFVLLDSDINSAFEVYNKSSYLYFNRIAKTNKEILDTLIEVSKEVDNRYNKLASVGVKNIDAYNEVAGENNLQTMPYIILVFNNYTSAAQATDHDRINACLYQILKYGRIAGIYAVVAAKLPIDVNQINYSLSSRISFRSDEDSTYTVGAEGVEALPSESDAMYYNIAANKTEHIKVATVTDMELDLIIKDLEE